MVKHELDTKKSSASKKQKGSNLSLPEKETKYLAKLMERHMHGQDKEGVKYETLRVELGIGLRVKSEMAAWKNLQEQGFIEDAGQKFFVLTEKGVEYAATPEYKEYVKDLNIVSLTNEDHHEKIKKHLKPQNKTKGGEIFDLLVKHGTLTAIELAALIKTKRGSHKFSYGLKELKDKGYIEVDPSPKRAVKGKPLRLADKAFLKPEDRSTPVVLDSVDLAKAVEENARKREDTGKKNDDEGEVEEKTAKGCGAKTKKEEKAAEEETEEDHSNVKKESALDGSDGVNKDDSKGSKIKDEETDEGTKEDVVDDGETNDGEMEKDDNSKEDPTEMGKEQNTKEDVVEDNDSGTDE